MNTTATRKALVAIASITGAVIVGPADAAGNLKFTPPIGPYIKLVPPGAGGGFPPPDRGTLIGPVVPPCHTYVVSTLTIDGRSRTETRNSCDN